MVMNTDLCCGTPCSLANIYRNFKCISLQNLNIRRREDHKSLSDAEFTDIFIVLYLLSQVTLL